MQVHRCVPVNVPKVLGTAFFIEQLWWLLLNYVLVSERNFQKRKLVERLPLNKSACFIYKYKRLQVGQITQEY